MKEKLNLIMFLRICYRNDVTFFKFFSNSLSLNTSLGQQTLFTWLVSNWHCFNDSSHRDDVRRSHDVAKIGGQFGINGPKNKLACLVFKNLMKS